MNPFLECQIFRKIKKLIKRGVRNFTAFQNILMNEDFYDAICAIDDLEENLSDILIFDVHASYSNHEMSMLGEISELEEMKNDLLNELEMKIAYYREFDDEDSLLELKEMTEK